MNVKRAFLVFMLLWLLHPFSVFAEVCDVDADGDDDATAGANDAKSDNDDNVVEADFEDVSDDKGDNKK